MPKSVGGQRKVPCCRRCNDLKGDIHPSVWRWFTEHYPGWWRTFATNIEVAQVCRQGMGRAVVCSMVGRAPRWDFEGRQDLATEAGERA